MATINLGRIKPVFRGAYSGATAYVVDDIVTHGNESFICIQAHGAGTQATSVTAYWTKLAAKGTDGTDLATTLTTQGDVLYRDGSGLQRLAKPASNKLLQMTSGGVPSWESVSSDVVKIASWNYSGAVSEVIFDDVFTSTYNSYRLHFSAIKPVSEGSSWLRIGYRTGGSSGASLSTTYYAKYAEQYGTYSATANGWGIQTDSVGAHIMNTWNLQTDNYHAYECSGTVDFGQMNRQNWKPSFLYTIQWTDNNQLGFSKGLAYSNVDVATTPITGIRMDLDGGMNFAQGSMTLFGFKA